MRLRIRLVDLHPVWLASFPGRHRMGLALDCPRHPLAAGDRAEVWFENPGDGGPPREGARVSLLLEEGEGFEHVTLVPEGGAPYDCLQLGHWCGWVSDGILAESFITGVAW